MYVYSGVEQPVMSRLRDVARINDVIPQIQELTQLKVGHRVIRRHGVKRACKYGAGRSGTAIQSASLSGIVWGTSGVKNVPKNTIEPALQECLIESSWGDLYESRNFKLYNSTTMRVKLRGIRLP